VQLHFNWDASVANAPVGFENAMNAAAASLDALITDNITVNIAVGWGEVHGTPITDSDGLAEGAPAGAATKNYADVRSLLTAHATSAVDLTACGDLPTTDPTNGSNFYICSAQAKAWGLIPANGGGVDGWIGFNSNRPWTFDPNARSVTGKYDLIGSAVHEITQALGRYASLDKSIPGFYMVQDLFRYSAPGVRSLVGGNPAYFSFDNGVTRGAAFDTRSDYADWAQSQGADSFGYGFPGQIGLISRPDIDMMDVLGFNVGDKASKASVISGTAAGQAVASGGGFNVNVSDGGLSQSDATTTVVESGSGGGTTGKFTMTTPTDPTFNIAGFQISESFSNGFLQSGSPLTGDINSFGHIHSLSDLVSLVAQIYHDAAKGGLKIGLEDTNISAGKSGISLVLAEGNNTIGTIGVSGPLPPASHVIGTPLHL
jgi:hypothetical protein